MTTPRIEASIAGPLPGAVYFKYSSLERYILIACVVFFGGATPLYPILALRESDWHRWIFWSGMVFFGGMACLGLLSLRTRWDQVAVDDDGLWYLPRRGAEVFVRWDDIQTIETHDGMQCLVVSDDDRSRRIQLGYSLEDFNGLREILLRRTPNRRRHPTPAIFHQSYLGRLASLLFALVFAAGCLWAATIAYASKNETGSGLTPFFLCAVAVFLSGFFVWAFVNNRRLIISDASFCVESLTTRRAVSFHDVNSIQLHHNLSSEGIRKTMVAVEIADRRRPLMLTGFGLDNIALYDALHAAWMAARGPGVPITPTSATVQRQEQTPRSAGHDQTVDATATFNTGILWFDLLLVTITVAVVVSYTVWLHNLAQVTTQLTVVVVLSVLLLVLYDIYFLWSFPLRYAIRADELAIHYPLRRLDFPYSSIMNVGLTKALEDGRVIERVRIEVKGRGPFSPSFRGRTQTFYQALDNAWRRSREEGTKL